jgi:dephospho-CoA kinase
VRAADGAIDRAALGAIVFADPDARRRLTDIVWPRARAAFEALAREQAAAGTRVLVLEAALLVEAGWRDLVDELWLVRAPEVAVRTRLQSRGRSPDEIEALLSAGPSDAAVAAADRIIENNGDLTQLEQRVEEAWLTLQSRGLL